MTLLSLIACLPSWPEFPRSDAEADSVSILDGVDDDGDGFTEADGDCDDSNPAINPQATDIVGDDIDQNCDGADGVDRDGDGHADGASGGDDCDDEDATAYPDAVETPDDGIDQDCDGSDEWTFTKVSCGEYHACALTLRGEVVCFGTDDHGQLTVPDGTYLDVAAGYTNTCAIRDDGGLACWGEEGTAQADPPSGKYTEVVSRTNNGRWSCSVREDLATVCWGDGLESDEVDDAPSDEVSGLDAGGFLCGLDAGGTVKCWGKYEDYRPSVERPTGTFVKVGVGSAHACVIDGDGALSCWGDDDYGQTDAPDGSFIDVDGGNRFTCSVATSGAVQCFGDYGGAPSGGDFESLCVNAENACGVRSDGSIECWGTGTGYGEPP